MKAFDVARRVAATSFVLVLAVNCGGNEPGDVGAANA